MSLLTQKKNIVREGVFNKHMEVTHRKFVLEHLVIKLGIIISLLRKIPNHKSVGMLVMKQGCYIEIE